MKLSKYHHQKKKEFPIFFGVIFKREF